jgi:hypothetical protein
MEKYSYKSLIIIAVALLFGCADNTLEEEPLDDNFPFQLVLDAEEGADIPDAEDYSVEVKFADYLPDLSLPNSTITLAYTLTDLEDDMIGNVVIDKIVYEVELDDCVYERELEFTSEGDGLTGVISITSDVDFGSVPESFEIVFTLPGLDDTEGGFKFELSNLKSSANLLLGFPQVFEYEVLDNDVAGEWELEIESEEEFENFKEVFGSLNPELEELSFDEITGKVKAEFEFEEMKFEIELVETEEVTTCEDGEEETETENKVIEIEAEYDAEDGEIEFEGSHEILNDNGLVEDELDFIIESEYELNEIDETVVFNFLSVIDEDNFKEGEELFRSDNGISFTFKKD